MPGMPDDLTNRCISTARDGRKLGLVLQMRVSYDSDAVPQIPCGGWVSSLDGTLQRFNYKPLKGGFRYA